MAKYMINRGRDTNPLPEREVEAESFRTTGEFVDFADHSSRIILRVRAEHVQTIERTEL